MHVNASIYDKLPSILEDGARFEMLRTTFMSVQAIWSHPLRMFQSPNPQWPLVTFDRTYTAQLVASESRRARNSNVIKVAVVQRNTGNTLGFSSLSSSRKADKTRQQRRFTGREKKKTEKWIKNSGDLTQREQIGCKLRWNSFSSLDSWKLLD